MLLNNRNFNLAPLFLIILTRKKRREANLKNDELISEKFWNTKGELVD